MSGPGMTEMRQDFLVADYPSGGTMNGIPAGTGRTVKAQGLDVNGLAMFQGVTNGITIQTGLVNDAGTIAMVDIVTATPPGGTYSSPQTVTLTANTDPTQTIIYYTTNGDDPVGAPSSTEKVGRPGWPVLTFQISSHTLLKFFANYGTSVENTPIKSEEYFIP